MGNVLKGALIGAAKSLVAAPTIAFTSGMLYSALTAAAIGATPVGWIMGATAAGYAIKDAIAASNDTSYPTVSRLWTPDTPEVKAAKEAVRSAKEAEKAAKLAAKNAAQVAQINAQTAHVQAQAAAAAAAAAAARGTVAPAATTATVAPVAGVTAASTTPPGVAATTTPAVTPPPVVATSAMPVVSGPIAPGTVVSPPAPVATGTPVAATPPSLTTKQQIAAWIAKKRARWFGSSPTPVAPGPTPRTLGTPTITSTIPATVVGGSPQTISGVATAGSHVVLIDHATGRTIVDTTADTTGAYSFTLTAPATDGAYIYETAEVDNTVPTAPRFGTRTSVTVTVVNPPAPAPRPSVGTGRTAVALQAEISTMNITLTRLLASPGAAEYQGEIQEIIDDVEAIRTESLVSPLNRNDLRDLNTRYTHCVNQYTNLESLCTFMDSISSYTNIPTPIQTRIDALENLVLRRHAITTISVDRNIQNTMNVLRTLLSTTIAAPRISINSRRSANPTINQTIGQPLPPITVSPFAVRGRTLAALKIIDDAGNIVPGATYNPVTGVISGLPMTGVDGQSDVYTLSYIDDMGRVSDGVDLTIDWSDAPVVTPPAPAFGSVDTFVGTIPSFTFTVPAGTMSASCELYDTGIPPALIPSRTTISGTIATVTPNTTPTTPGRYSAEMTYTDATTGVVSDLLSHELSLTAAPLGVLPSITSVGAAPSICVLGHDPVELEILGVDDTGGIMWHVDGSDFTISGTRLTSGNYLVTLTPTSTITPGTLDISNIHYIKNDPTDARVSGGLSIRGLNVSTPAAPTLTTGVTGLVVPGSDQTITVGGTLNPGGLPIPPGAVWSALDNDTPPNPVIVTSSIGTAPNTFDLRFAAPLRQIQAPIRLSYTLGTSTVSSGILEVLLALQTPNHAVLEGIWTDLDAIYTTDRDTPYLQTDLDSIVTRLSALPALTDPREIERARVYTTTADTIQTIISCQNLHAAIRVDTTTTPVDISDHRASLSTELGDIQTNMSDSAYDGIRDVYIARIQVMIDRCDAQPGLTARLGEIDTYISARTAVQGASITHNKEELQEIIDHANHIRTKVTRGEIITQRDAELLNAYIYAGGSEAMVGGLSHDDLVTQVAGFSVDNTGIGVGFDVGGVMVNTDSASAIKTKSIYAFANASQGLNALATTAPSLSIHITTIESIIEEVYNTGTMTLARNTQLSDITNMLLSNTDPDIQDRGLKCQMFMQWYNTI